MSSINSNYLVCENEGQAIGINTSVTPYDSTVEVRNRFKGLDLIDRVPDELWMEVHDIVRKKGARPSPRKRNAKKQNDCLRKP